MKLSALLLLAAASACTAQIKPAPSLQQAPSVAIVDDQALGQAAASMAAAASIDQLQKMVDRVNEANCPVVLTSAWLTPHLMLLNSGGPPSSGNGVDLQFRNASGKAIRSMELSATILVKKSIYDLHYLPAIHLYLTAYGTSSVDETFTELRHLSLPTGIHPALVQDLTLQQVTFADGSVWTGRGDQHCGFRPGQTLPVAR